MAVVAARKRLPPGDPRLLAETRQGIELAQDGDDRPALPGLAHDGGREARDAPGHAEALRLEHGGVLGTGKAFLEIQFGRVEDPVAQREEGLALRLDQIPDPGGVRQGHDASFHVVSPTLGAGLRKPWGEPWGTPCGSTSVHRTDPMTSTLPVRGGVVRR